MGSDRRLPAAAYAVAEAQPEYDAVWRIENRGDLVAVLERLPPLVVVRAAFFAARGVEPILDGRHRHDRRMPVAIMAIEHFLRGRLRGRELIRFVAPADDSASMWISSAGGNYARATQAVASALESAIEVAYDRSPVVAASQALMFAALTVGHDCSASRGVLAPVVREHLAREWTAGMLRVAKQRGVRLYGSLEERAVAIDVALDSV